MAYNSHTITTGLTKEISAYIYSAKFEDFPPAVVERAKMFILHTLGVSLSSTELWQYRDAAAIAKELSPGAGGENLLTATLWGDGAKVSPGAAGFVAGTMADMLDWEDCSWGGHPSAGVIPAAVIGAEIYHKSGKELLEAVIISYEVFQRLSKAAGGIIIGNNIFGALIPLLHYLQLNEAQINQALGLAAACSIIHSGIHESTMSDSLNYEYGFWVEQAFLIAGTELAGVEGMYNAFDDPTAFFLHMNAQDTDFLTKKLGQEYYLMDILIKHWPANMYCQTYAELAHTLLEKYKINPDDIAEIHIDPAVEFRYWFSETGYKSLTAAQFSIPYVVAATFYHPEPGAVWYQPETLEDPKIVALMNKVVADSFVQSKRGMLGLYYLIKGEHPEKFMTVRLKDGTEYKEGLFTHPGHPSYMLTRNDFQERFRLQTKNAVSSEKAEAAIAFVNSLEQQNDVAELTQYLY